MAAGASAVCRCSHASAVAIARRLRLQHKCQQQRQLEHLNEQHNNISINLWQFQLFEQLYSGSEPAGTERHKVR